MKTSRLSQLLLATILIVTSATQAFCGDIHDAARAGDLEKVKALLKANPESVNAKDDGDWTPLHYAVNFSHKEMAELLLANKAEVNAKTNDGLTPLHMATLTGHKDVVGLLLANGAEVNASATNGSTPLYVAAQHGYREIAELLLANNADVNTRAANGATPLCAAIYGGHTDIVKLLLANKADVNVEVKLQSPLPELFGTLTTPLETALVMGHREIADLLRAHGATTVEKMREHKRPIPWIFSTILAALMVAASVLFVTLRRRQRKSVGCGEGRKEMRTKSGEIKPSSRWWSVVRRAILALVALYGVGVLLQWMPRTSLESNVNFHFFLFVARATAALTSLLGIETVRIGTGICSSGCRFDVAAPASTIRFGVVGPSTMLITYAYVTQRINRNRWIAFLSAVPLAVLSIIVRFISILFVLRVRGQEAAFTIYHEYSGLIQLAVSLSAAIGIGLVLSLSSRRGLRKPKEVSEPFS